MVWIPGGAIRMGSEDFYPEERPVREVQVDGFWIDRHPVTNRQFARFVAATGYVTVAEQPLDPALYPGAPAENLVAGSMVFTPTSGPVDLRNAANWWAWTSGADWKHPRGPGSSLDGLDEHPVVQVALTGAPVVASQPRARPLSQSITALVPSVSASAPTSGQPCELKVPTLSPSTTA